jgi:hypothetical protein
MKNKECFCTSILFLINALVAYHYNYNQFSLAFLLLTITSLFHHYHYNSITRNLDRIPILLISIYSIIIFNKKKSKINLFQKLYFAIALLSVLYLYVYGYFKNKYSYDKDHTTACRWHSFLHIIVCASLLYLTII